MREFHSMCINTRSLYSYSCRVQIWSITTKAVDNTKVILVCSAVNIRKYKNRNSIIGRNVMQGGISVVLKNLWHE